MKMIQPPKHKLLPKRLNGTAELFQDVMLNLVQRRELFSCLYSRMRIGSSSFTGNSFYIFYCIDYLRSQLVDCRLFFENNSDAHRLSDLNKLLNDKDIDLLYKKLSRSWGTVQKNASLKQVINKTIVHKQRNFQQNQQVRFQVLNDFIDAAEEYMQLLVQKLTKEHYNFISLDFSSSSPYIKSMSNDVDEFINHIASIKKYL